MQYRNNIELSSHEETRCQFSGSKAVIKLGKDVHEDFYVVVMQEGGANLKPAQRFQKEASLRWAAKVRRSGADVPHQPRRLGMAPAAAGCMAASRPRTFATAARQDGENMTSSSRR